MQKEKTNLIQNHDQIASEIAMLLFEFFKNKSVDETENSSDGVPLEEATSDDEFSI